MVDPAAGSWLHAHIADGRLAERAELELGAVGDGPEGRPRARPPVLARQAQFRRRLRVGIQPEVSGGRAVNRMADVVGEPRVRVVPQYGQPPRPLFYTLPG